MREISFRGKRIDNGEWIEGYLAYGNIIKTVRKCFDWRGDYVCDSLEEYKIDKETVGQFTGFTDKNGKKIFEGDIVVTRYPKGDICSIGDVQFDSGVFGAEWTAVKANKGMVGAWGQTHNLRRFDDGIIKNIEVIGNIYDNPELLKELQNG